MGGYNSSDDEREEGRFGGGHTGLGQASTPPEYRFLAAGRRSLMEYLLSTSSTGSGVEGSTGAAAGLSIREVVAAPEEPPRLAPSPPPGVMAGLPRSGGGGGGGSVADSASFERIGAFAFLVPLSL
jgi:hypothetical protein